VGHCVNLLPVRGRWDATTTLAAHLAAVQEETALAREHQGFTLGTLVRRLDLPRTTGRLPLADVQFNLERMAQPGDRGGLALRASTIGKAFVNFDLFVNVIEQDDGLRIECDYNTDLFDETTVRRWLGHYEALLGALVQDAAQTVVSVPLLRPEERAALTLRDTGPVRALPPESGLDASIKYWKDADPDRPAISFEAMHWSYAELDCQVELLVQQLRQRIAGREARIGILLERSPILVAALLAVLRAGFTYVPFDPRHPPVRVRRLAERAELSLLITDRPPPEGLDLPVLQPGQPSPPLFAGTDFSATADEAAPAYLLFTSGSTGEPKGVEVGRRALDNLLLAMAERPGLGPQDRLVAVTTVTFDIAALELFLPLTVGARLVIAEQEDAVDGFALQQLMRDSGATMLQATPATWRLLLEAGFRSHPGFRMLCGGEPLPRDLANALLEGGGELWNMYGPTETTIWSSCGRVLPGDAPITIGEPIANTTLHVLDRHGQPVVPGVIGELWIGGEGVAAGYFRAPQLTAERFRPVPVGLGVGRFYGTGDLARWTPNGQLELLGRRDSQIKLRGFRIELSEVEASLSRLAGVQAAAVVLVGSGAEARLVAHVVLQPGQDWDPKRLREALRQWLPDYMVPAGWVQLDAMPLTPNRKLDRAALVAMKPEPVPAARPTAPPSLDPLEARIAAIVVEVLGLDAIGPADDLLALGADSLQLFQIAARAQRKGLPLAARHLMEHPTVGALARLIGSQVPTAEVPRLMQFKRAGRT
ncbi:MAG: amino acid adenylation domain-containing protein, partial [Acetobacteraceae bacterium]